jgi:arsenate reductase
MAEGLLRHDAGTRYEVSSAGTKPGGLRAEAVRAMREIGIDISQHRSKSVDEFAGQKFDVVITVCDHARDTCPVFPSATERIHWSIEDPSANVGTEEARMEAFRRARDTLRARLAVFVKRGG